MARKAEATPVATAYVSPFVIEPALEAGTNSTDRLVRDDVRGRGHYPARAR